ncbi:TPA: hypothetical protein NGT43_002834 [Vibrio parahaemolyticus]|uniref:hypothetical protein n=1 Tax=Vibrio parahaemolyticus TaxID=670 RepID=UPI000470D898|nr:hypothetical protein [Vibrio parahaemolyticus]MBM4872190.1 hypothetical protein [Vibrio parahaemolyticus]RFD39483.1 hypothetical protein BS586_16740 [Vibrio parahaemolyticus]TNZ92472.1 hypothetical protein CGK37_13330 [Vibrio parahaemolyticus]TOA13305.1 hypothetical protein CGK34_12900 [Vibrio parahaemolyticus]TOB05766.1 hypothetical protein CGK14_06585 [Vibrio parahaemolyticus]
MNEIQTLHLHKKPAVMLAFFMSAINATKLSSLLQANLFPVLDHKHASLLKKKANDVFWGIYLKKLLTDLTQLRIMRAVPNDKATKR